MALHHTAQGLAALGRRGDSVLVHMQPQEVAGLQALAQSRGTSLTINPATGMPEAFNLGGFFKSLLPTLIGIGTGGAGLPLYAGIAAGAGVGALTNDDPLMGALMGGLGGYGGQGIGSSLFNAGATAAPAAATTTAQAGATTGTQLGQNIGTQLTNAGANMSDPLVQDLIKQQVNSSVATIPQQGMFNAGTVNPATMATNLPYQNAQIGVPEFIQGSGPNMGQVNPVTPTPGLTVNTSGGYKPFGDIAMDNLSQTGRGFSGVMSGDEAALEAFRKGMGAESNLGAFGKSMLPVGGAALGGIEPSDLGYGGPSIDDIRKKTKYRGPSGQLNLDSNYNQDTGEYEGLPSLQLATGGTVNTNRGTTSTGGIQDLYGSNDNTGTAPLSQDGYGIGRLDKLAQQGSLSKAGDMFYAAGGPVSFADGGLNLESSSNLNVETGENNKGLGSLAMPLDAMLGGSSGAFIRAVLSKAGSTGKDGAGSDGSGMGEGLKWMLDPAGKAAGVSFEEYLANKNAASSAEPTQQGPQGPGYTESIVPTGPNLGATEATPYGTYEVARPPVASTASYQGDTNTPFMAKGGYLDGPGDGLSDSIPATIEGKQPARLADGEFVVSADVVSALGNGSSKAGAKHLYAMMDRVRQNAHGTKKQIRKVNTKRVMPA